MPINIISVYWYTTKKFTDSDCNFNFPDCGDEKCRPAVHCTSQFSKKKGLNATMKGCKLDNGNHGVLCKDVCKMNGPKVAAELIHTAGFGSGGLTLVKPFDTSRQVLS